MKNTLTFNEIIKEKNQIAKHLRNLAVFYARKFGKSKDKQIKFINVINDLLKENNEQQLIENLQVAVDEIESLEKPLLPKEVAAQIENLARITRVAA